VRLLRQTGAVAAKDLRVEVRGRHALAAALPFAGTLLISMGLALGPGRSLLEATAPALLWIGILFSAVLAARQSYLTETEDAAMEGIVLSPADRAAVFLGKASAIALELLVLEAVVVAAVVLLFDLSLAGSAGVSIGGFVLGTVGLAALTTMFGGVSVSPGARESILPLLVLPLATPVLLAGVRVTELAVSGRAAEAGSWLGLMLAFDAVVVATGFLLFGQVLEE
jgi:heme exporter protein B